jgi:hypothetical protein
MMFTAVNIPAVGIPIGEVHSCELRALAHDQAAEKAKGMLA